MTHSDLLDPTPSQAPKPPRISRLATVALGMAIFGALTFFLVIPSLVALVLALIAGRQIKKNPARLGGLGFANAAATVSLCTVCLPVLVAILLPSLGGGGPSVRGYCAANLRGIVQSMVVYSNENNDMYPVVPFAPYSAALNSPTASATESTKEDALKSYYKAPFPQAGSVAACLWILVLNDQCSPQQFICKSDPAPTTIAQVQSPAGNYYNNFQSDMQLSYSAAYPWKADGSVGKWWTNTTDSSLPIMADMAPEQGTGSPRRDLASATAPLQARNSGNHGNNGQEVVFADAHTEWCPRPDIGQKGDNIFTTSGRPSTGPSPLGIPATKSSPALTADKPPYDIILYPIRNLTTGRL